VDVNKLSVFIESSESIIYTVKIIEKMGQERAFRSLSGQSPTIVALEYDTLVGKFPKNGTNNGN